MQPLVTPQTVMGGWGVSRGHATVGHTVECGWGGGGFKRFHVTVGHTIECGESGVMRGHATVGHTTDCGGGGGRGWSREAMQPLVTPRTVVVVVVGGGGWWSREAMQPLVTPRTVVGGGQERSCNRWSHHGLWWVGRGVKRGHPPTGHTVDCGGWVGGGVSRGHATVSHTMDCGGSGFKRGHATLLRL